MSYIDRVVKAFDKVISDLICQLEECEDEELYLILDFQLYDLEKRRKIWIKS